MPRPKVVLNAFTAREVAAISGLSHHMVGYLANAGFLPETYRPGGGNTKGSVRYYSYRDLLVARIVRRFSEAGIELKRVKKALVDLRKEEVWQKLGPAAACALLVTDGKNIFMCYEDGSIIDLTRGRQHSFAFVIDLAEADADIRSRCDATRLHHFSYDDKQDLMVVSGYSLKA
jgi:DNA-binding transcriptional MerR regulator